MKILLLSEEYDLIDLKENAIYFIIHLDANHMDELEDYDDVCKQAPNKFGQKTF